MKLTAFRVVNYRSVNDSGWIKIDPLTVIAPVYVNLFLPSGGSRVRAVIGGRRRSNKVHTLES